MADIIFLQRKYEYLCSKVFWFRPPFLRSMQFSFTFPAHRKKEVKTTQISKAKTV